MTHPRPDTWRLFWAKTDRDRRETERYDPEWTRPLWAHLLDVAHVALALWERVVPDALRRRAAADLGLSEREAGVWLSLWIGLHDLGKATPSFQFQDPGAPYLARMRRHGFTLTGASERIHHGHATIGILVREWLDEGGPLDFRESLGAFIGFHHGRLIPKRRWREMAHVRPEQLGGPDWREQQGHLLRAVHDAWAERYGLVPPTQTPDGTPDWLLGLAGWATLADWLGSYAKAFPGQGDPLDPGGLDDIADYFDASLDGADRALRLTGVGTEACLTGGDFATLFPELAAFEPRPVQQALLDLDLPESPAEPTLTIVEAPTGEGKTEAALALAARQQARCERGGGVYLALPTQATANGMLNRARDFLDAAQPEGVAPFVLAYGRAELHPEAPALLADPDELAALFDEDDQASRVRTLRWFTGRKRALLAPYGLGTIDQALLGALYARHFFVRLFGLAGKTVAVDEVHAYDTYMDELILRLLPWLRALGTHVILLSATLPARTRRKLLAAWDSSAKLPDEPEPAALGYPAVWTLWGGAVRVQAGALDGLTASRTQRCALERGDPAPDAIAGRVAEAVAQGATVAVVCNTVRRAQDVFQDLHARLGETLPPDDLVLFHARFVRRERQRIEDRVLARFGKGRAGGPAVLVGTQVIEQSLDLDVDLMLSDLAPVDLLLQRAGRLHRHDRTDRPAAHAVSRLVWLCPAWDGGDLPDVTDLSGHGYVYARTALWRTAALLRDRAAWSLPADYRPLIEAVYGADDLPGGLSDDARRDWKTEAKTEDRARRRSTRNARARVIPKPTALAEMLRIDQPSLADDDDETAHADLKAFTREGESVEVVVLHAGEGGAFYLDPDAQTPLPLPLPQDHDARTEAVRAILGASLSLSQRAFVTHLRDRPQTDTIPHGWQTATDTAASLRGLHPVVMKDRVWQEAARPLRWTAALGLATD